MSASIRECQGLAQGRRFPTASPLPRKKYRIQKHLNTPFASSSVLDDGFHAGPAFERIEISQAEPDGRLPTSVPKRKFRFVRIF
jgi:hypothetical protein